MSSQWAMAGFAGYPFVHALALNLQNVAVTIFADLMSGIVDWKGSSLSYRVCTVMSVAAKAARHQETADDQKENQTEEKNRCQTKEVSRILENLHALVQVDGSAPARGPWLRLPSSFKTIHRRSILGLI